MVKVLVVDDRYDNVKLLAFELVDHGYDVVTAFSGCRPSRPPEQPGRTLSCSIS